MQTNMPPRFSEAPRESDAETARWASYGTLRDRRAILGDLVRRLTNAYPVASSPSEIDAAISAVEDECDELTERMDELEDGDA